MKNCTDYIVSSPAEVPAKGILNTTALKILSKNCDLETRLSLLCDSYIDQSSGSISGQSISVMRTSDIKNLAKELKAIKKIDLFNSSEYPYYPFRLQKVFFDLRTFLNSIGYGLIYDKNVMYSKGVNIGDYSGSGLSIFIPLEDNERYQQSYKSLPWNQYAHWLEKFE